MFISILVEQGVSMPRPCCLRHIGSKPPARFFKPAGVPACALEQVILTLDEVETLRLADLNGLYQEQAAAQMKISRPTFSRIVEAARRKVADALIHGKALRLEGGAVRMKEEAEMPDGAGTGPLGSGRGAGQRPCGCEHRRNRAAEDAGKFGQCRSRHGPVADAPAAGESHHRNNTQKGEQES
jgi:predicted DNA-binding protein (UPF0251 family)